MKPLTARSTNAEWVGKTVRSKSPIRTRFATFPAGTRFLVTRKFNGLHLESLPCATCGLSLRARNVPFSQVEVVGESE